MELVYVLRDDGIDMVGSIGFESQVGKLLEEVVSGSA